MDNKSVVERIDEISTLTKAGHDAVRRDYSELRDRIEGLEARADLPRGAGDSRFSREDHEHKSVFLEWVRRPTDARRIARMAEAQHAMEQKDVTIGTGSAGGYGLPKEISSLIEQRVRQLNPFRGLVDVQTCNTNDFHSLVSMGDGTSGWVAETGARTTTLSPNLRDVAPPMAEQYAYPTASNWSLQDLFFDVQSWLVNDIAADWSAAEATAIISGTGVAQPWGILKNAPVATSDTASPMRNQDTIQFIPLTSAPSPLRLNIDSLIDLVGTVRERYLQEADRVAFCMHRLTLAGLRKLKSVTAGNYLWEPDSQAGGPTTLLGYKVVTTDAMPTNSAGNFPVVFGNFRRGYLLADRIGMSIVVDQVTTPGYTKFYVARRLGGRIKNNDALKCVKLA